MFAKLSQFGASSTTTATLAMLAVSASLYYCTDKLFESSSIRLTRPERMNELHSLPAHQQTNNLNATHKVSLTESTKHTAYTVLGQHQHQSVFRLTPRSSHEGDVQFNSATLLTLLKKTNSIDLKKYIDSLSNDDLNTLLPTTDEWVKLTQLCEQKTVLCAVFMHWASLNVYAALEHVSMWLNLANLTGTDNDIATQALQAIALVDPVTSWQWLQQSNNANNSQLKSAILETWLRTDPSTAINVVLTLDNGPEKKRLLLIYTHQQITDNPLNAYLWARALNNIDTQTRTELINTVAKEWALSNAESLWSFLIGLDPSEERWQLLQNTGDVIAAFIISTDPYIISTWANQLDPREQRYFKPLAFQIWINADAEQALNWLSQVSDASEAALYMSTSAASLPYKNLTLTLDIYASLSYQNQYELSGAIAYNLQQKDALSASQWAESLNSTELREEARLGILYASISTSPEAALQSALDYVGNKRIEVLSRTFMEVDQQFPNLIKTWLEKKQLSEAEIADVSQALVRYP